LISVKIVSRIIWKHLIIYEVWKRKILVKHAQITRNCKFIKRIEKTIYKKFCYKKMVFFWSVATKNIYICINSRIINSQQRRHKHRFRYVLYLFSSVRRLLYCMCVLYSNLSIALYSIRCWWKCRLRDLCNIKYIYLCCIVSNNVATCDENETCKFYLK